MKKIAVFFIITACLFVAKDIYGDGEASTRAKCRWGWKYKAYSAVKCGSAAKHLNKMTGCSNSNVWAYAWDYDYNFNPAIKCVQQETTNGPNGVKYGGFNYTKRCWRGNPKADFLVDYDIIKDDILMSPMITTSILDSERVDITTGTIEFDSVENTITIPNINGYNRSMFTDYVSSFTITIWEPNDLDPGDDEDSVITETKTKWLAKATLLNGDLSLTNFTETQVSLTNTDSGYVMNLNDFTKVIEFPETTLVNNLIVTIETHGEEDAASLMQAVSVRTDEMQKKGLISFNVYPNPSTDNISIKFKDKQIKDFKACVYDISGHRILNFDSGSMSNNTGDEVTLKINISTLPKGTYFISIQNNGKGYIQKIVKK
ncbi:MAG: T9SS type A sorting domain-containing protein [Nitrososphaeraceae archaeon]